MAMEDCAVRFLGQLEREEMRVLTWGLVDGFFSEDELEEKADRFLVEHPSEENTPYDSGWDLIEALLDRQMLWKLPGVQRYRTRLAESVRLLARLRQIFPDPNNSAWRTAPNLVADYRLLLRPRLYPVRSISPSDFLARLRSTVTLSEVQESAIYAILRAGTSDERQLADFQVRATERILRIAGQERSFGTVVSAGTGSGKTLAFYLPAYATIVTHLSRDYWTKCLALYPRNELLKDQLREALANARRIAPELHRKGKRKILIGALYGDVPNSRRNVTSGENPWSAVVIRGQRAYKCPFIRCPRCSSDMAWLDSDLQRDVERLVCLERDCSEQIESDEICLTRQRMLSQAPDVLFTSTEMLNQRLSSSRFAPLFGIGLRRDRRPLFVLIDEVHAYEGIHGAHVALLLRRWRRVSSANPHFVGLSATLADGARFFGDLVGVGPGDVTEVSPNPEELRGKGAEYMIALRGDPSSGTSLLSTTIQTLMLLQRLLAVERANEYFGTRTFAFTDNLDVINRLYHNLLDAEGWDPFGRPNPRRALGSLANLRSTTLQNAYERFEGGQNWALVEDIGHVLAPGSRIRVGRTSSQDVGVDAEAGIVVATSSLEVGFDDPEVGAVLQHKAPQSTAAFLQRKGRAGRRDHMRPWTVVVLSDYGRDRSAYQNYDRLFSPYLPARQLPLANRAVLRMQATFSLFDWLTRQLPPNRSPEPWSDFSQPASEIGNPQGSAAVAERQALYAQFLRAILEQESVREDFASFLEKSLSITQQEVLAILWEPPRSLIMETVPTLLRRLERGWRKADGSGLEPFSARAPLSEFVPRTLFSDLQLPEVTIRIPQQGRIAARTESMPVAQALREFAPGRVSRRFGVTHGRERHWVDPNNGSEVFIESFCPAADRQDLGLFRYKNGDGIETEIRVFRPHSIELSITPATVQQSSNSFLRWHAEIVPTGDGHQVDLPETSPWRAIVKSICIQSHQLGLPVELRRFAIGASASVGRGAGAQTLYSLKFVYSDNAVATMAGAVGFAGDVDAIRVKIQYPGQLHELCARDERLVRGLRTARFRDLVRGDIALNGIANEFQREWLSQVYSSTITITALQESVSIEGAEALVHEGRSRTSTRQVLETIMQWSEGESDNDDSDSHGQDVLPRRLRELSELLDTVEAKNALHQNARVLWGSIEPAWEDWLRIRYKSSLGAAFVDAAHNLCPRMSAGTFVLDLEALSHHHGDPQDTDEFWITESTIGGSGFVEDFLRQYSEDPRRFFRYLDSSLAASDLETVSDDLGRVLRLATSNPESNPLSAAFLSVREAESHEQTVQALSAIKSDLARNGIQPGPTLLISLNARVLRPGTNIETDRFLLHAVEEWEESERRLGLDIDARVFALVKSADAALDNILGSNQVIDPDSAMTWRYGVLNGMFWPRGAQVRRESLRAWNPFERLPDCDRLLVLVTVPRPISRVSLSNLNWFAELAELLVKNGTAELACEFEASQQMSMALLRIGVEPVDSEALLVHARLIATRREGNTIISELELPEALQ